MISGINSTEAFEFILKNSSLRIFFKNLNLKYIECNDLFAKDAGFKKKEDVIGKNDYMMSWRENADKYKTEDNLIIKNNISIINKEQIQKKIDGSEFWFKISKIPMHDNEGNVIGIFGVYDEISEKKKKDNEFNNILYELEKSNKELEQFAYAASHDLKEPIRTIANYLTLLEKKFSNIEQKESLYIKKSINAAVRMQNMIDDLLIYSSVNIKSLQIKKCNTEIIFKNACSNLKFIIDKKRAEITYNKLQYITADESQLLSVFQNLLNNAIKFCDKKTPRIHVTCANKKEEWIFCVKDNGIGIKKENYEKIFDVFQKLNNNDDYPGTGIGLSIVKKIIDKHKGKIWIESKFGKSTSIYFTIKK